MSGRSLWKKRAIQQVNSNRKRTENQMKIFNKLSFYKKNLSCLSADGSGAIIMLQCSYDPVVYGIS